LVIRNKFISLKIMEEKKQKEEEQELAPEEKKHWRNV
jgi:hypothetical protein